MAMAVLAASSYYLYVRYLGLVVAPPAPPVKAVAPVVKPPRPFLGAEDIKKVRGSTAHYDPGVRWTALELLYRLGDPEAVKYIEKAVASDPDPELRLKAVKLLGSRLGPAPVHTLVRGLKDFDKSIRLASLDALAAIGEPAAIPWIMETATKDYEPEVRAAALRALGKFQDKRRQEFDELAVRLRQQYEAAVERYRLEQEKRR